MNSKEENSEDFCLDFVQEFGLSKAGPCDLCFKYIALTGMNIEKVHATVVTVLQGKGGDGGGGGGDGGGGGGGGEGDPTDVSSSYTLVRIYFSDINFIRPQQRH